MRQDELYTCEKRIDGRLAKETRLIESVNNVTKSDGSILLKQGNTHVLTTVYGPHSDSTKSNRSEKVSICCIYNKTPFASVGGDRRVQTYRDRSAIENAGNIEEIFSNIIHGSKYKASSIDIFVEILQSDGSEFVTAINSVTLALIDAGIELHQFVVATTVGLYGNVILADMCRLEENSKIPRLDIAFYPRQSRVGILQGFNNSSNRSEDNDTLCVDFDSTKEKICYLNFTNVVDPRHLEYMVAESEKIGQLIYSKLADQLRSRIIAHETVLETNKQLKYQ